MAQVIVWLFGFKDASSIVKDALIQKRILIQRSI